MLVSIIVITVLSAVVMFFAQFYLASNGFDTRLRKMQEAFNEKKFDVVAQYLDGFDLRHRYDARVLWIAANMYVEQQQYILAMLQLQEIINRAGFSTEISEIKVYRMFAKLLEDSGNIKKALEVSQIASKLSFEDFDTVMETAVLAYKNTRYHIASHYLSKALEIKSDDPTVYFLLADISFKNKSYKNAKDYIKKAIEIEGYKPAYSLLSGKISFVERNYTDAVVEFIKVFEKNEELKRETASYLGNAYYELKDYNNADKYYSFLLDDEKYIGDATIIDERYRYAQIQLTRQNYEKALEQWKIIKTLRNIYLDIDEKIKTYTTIINSPAFRTALKTNIVEYLEQHLYRILTLNGYIVTGYVKKSATSIYFTAMKKFSDEGQSYLCAFALDTSGNKVRKETMANFYEYVNEKQTLHAFFLSIGGFACSSISDNIELIEPDRFEAILEGVVSFSN